MTVLAVDPGSERSAWLILEHGRPKLVGGTATDEPMYCHGIAANDDLLAALRVGGLPNGLLGIAGVTVVIEWTAPRGMPASAELFETLWWAGRFAEAAYPERVERLKRLDIKRHLCGTTAANDANVRAALIDRFGGAGGKAFAIGLKASPGPLYGISKDVWSALAIAVTWADREGKQ